MVYPTAEEIIERAGEMGRESALATSGEMLEDAHTARIAELKDAVVEAARQYAVGGPIAAAMRQLEQAE